jgi:hypothetical protein
MKFKRKLPVFAVAVCIAVTALEGHAQKALELDVKESVAVPNRSDPLLVGPIDCDSDSNVFFMPSTGRRLPNTVVSVSSDGRKTTQFRLDSAPEFEKSEVLSYAVGTDDHLYVLTGKENGSYYVVRFEKDGQFGSATKLEVAKDVFLRRLAVAAGENYLVGGSRQEGDKFIGEQFDGIFNGHGQMIAPVKLKLAKHDTPEGSLKASDIPHLDAAQMSKAEKLQQVVDLSVVRAGDDGNFYFSPFDPKSPVFVISPSGEVVKEIHVVSPKEPDFQLLDIKVSKGNLAVAYEGEPPQGGTAPVEIYVYHVQTGKPTAQFRHQNPRIGVTLACYSPDTFTFISSENGIMRLVTAAAR